MHHQDQAVGRGLPGRQFQVAVQPLQTGLDLDGFGARSTARGSQQDQGQANVLAHA